MPSDILQVLRSRFSTVEIIPQGTCDQIPTVWVSPEHAGAVLRYLKLEAVQPYRMLYDLCALDERDRAHRQGQPTSDFTVVYHLLSYERNADIPVKVPLCGEYPTLPSMVDLWPGANWYEREVFDLFGALFHYQALTVSHPIRHGGFAPHLSDLVCLRTRPK